MKKIIVVTLLLALSACTSGEPAMTANTGSGGWDKMAYVNPTYKPNWGVMKALEQPGIY